jgi:heme A synthase
LLLIISNIGIAVVIVPIMWRRYKELSVGYVTARLIESAFILVGVVAMLGIITLRNANGSACLSHFPGLWVRR